MTISRDTSLEEILKSEEVTEIVTEMCTSLQGKINPRIEVLEHETSSGGLSASVLIGGEPLFYQSAESIKMRYTGLSESLQELKNSFITTAEEKEEEELNELKSCVEKDTENCRQNIQNYVISYNSKKNNLEDGDTAGKQQLDNEYYGVNGYITLINKRIEENDLKIEQIMQRLVRLRGWTSYEAAAQAGYSNILTRREFLRRKSSGNENYNQYDTYQDYLDAMYRKYILKEEETQSAYSNNGEYALPAEDKTANEIYHDAINLQEEIETEAGYLREYKMEIEYSLGVLENYHNEGTIDDNTYNQCKTQYEETLALVTAQIDVREEFYDQIHDQTVNKFGFRDGALKDARDWRNNDVETAQNIVQEINNSSFSIIPIGEIVSQQQVDGSTIVPYAISSIYGDDMYGQYSENLSGLVYNPNGTHASLTTMELAYTVAQNNGSAKELEGYNGIYLFSTSDYLSNEPANSFYPIASMYGSSSVMPSQYIGSSTEDTVYDSNTGMYYSYWEFMNMQ